MRSTIGALRCILPPTVMLLALAARGEVYPSGDRQPLFEERSFPTPANWRIPALSSGKTFQMSTYYRTFTATVHTLGGSMPFSELPWAREAIVRIGYPELKDPAVFEDLLKNRTNPIMIFGYGKYMQPHLYPGAGPAQIDEYFALIEKARQAFGPRFLGLDYGEWSWGGVSRDKTTRAFHEDMKLLGISPPTDRDEAAAWWDKTYDVAFKRYQDAGIPIYSFNCTSLNHYEARKGASITGNEIAYGNPAKDSTFLAFCRGAARQFGIPWGVYAAEYPSCYTSGCYRPDERRLRGGQPRGPYSGQPFPQVRRTLYTAYMAGANFLQKENDTGMLAGYDPLTADRTDPRILALQDKGKQYPGPYALFCAELHDKVVNRHHRGTPYTPIALLFDRNHGYAFKYSKTLAVGGIPYTAADEQIRGVVNTIFPWESGNDPAGPFGEIFDVITTEASPAMMGSYRAVVLVGGVRVDADLARVLREFVEGGGLLFMVCEQMTPELWRLAGIADTGETATGSGYLRASDFYVYDQDSFTYHKVELQGAEPLFVARRYEDRVWPVATINRVGRGAVIVGTPVWLNVQGDPARMHGLFSEIMTLIADELVPVGVHGNEVKVMYNRNEAGWVVTLMNNRGITSAYPGYKPARRERSAAGVILRPRFTYAAVTEWLTGEEPARVEDDGSVGLLVPPGDIRIVEFTLQGK